MANFSDDFNRTDNPSSLGANWTALSGTWGVFSNSAVKTAGSGWDAAVHDSGTSDVTVSAKLLANRDDYGVVVRASASNSFLMAVFESGTVLLYRNNAGSFSVLGSGPVTFSVGAAVAVTANGTTLSVTYNGSTVVSALTSSFNQTSTQHGVVQFSATTTETRLDDFSVTDGGGGGGGSTSATAAVTAGAFTASASVTQGTTASASVAPGAFTATASVTQGTTAAASATPGAFSASASASPVAAGATSAAASVAVGGFTATASASLGASCSAAVTPGGFAGSASVLPGTSAAASAAPGAFVASASANPAVPGTSAAASVTAAAFTASASAAPAAPADPGADWVVYDFSGVPDGTALEDVPEQVGGPWLRDATLNDQIKTVGGRIYDAVGNGTNEALYYADAVPAQLDQQITVNWRPVNANSQTGVVFRTSHWVFYDFGGQFWSTYYIGAGEAPGARSSDPGRFTLHSDYTVVFSEIGDTVTASVGGAAVYSYTLSGPYAVTVAGKNGVMVNSAGFQGTTDMVQVASFVAGPPTPSTSATAAATVGAFAASASVTQGTSVSGSVAPGAFAASASLAPSAAALPPDLVAAVVARLRARGVGAALGEADGPPRVVKIVSDEAVGSPGLPWLEVTETGGTREYAGGGNYIERGQLDVSVYAAGKLRARQLGELVANPGNATPGALDDPPLAWAGGRLMKFRLRDWSFGKPAAPAPGAPAAYHRLMTFDYWFSGSIS